MPASAPSSSLKPLEWPTKFCTNCQCHKVTAASAEKLLTRSRSRRALYCEVAAKKRVLRRGEHARELLFLRRVRCRAALEITVQLQIEAHLALHVAEEQGANARLRPA